MYFRVRRGVVAARRGGAGAGAARLRRGRGEGAVVDVCSSNISSFNSAVSAVFLLCLIQIFNLLYLIDNTQGLFIARGATKW